ncbi:hypothetical protein Taro_005597 [Colocasia esculenta]|uniref:Uncharacterized protein n=1 Tax=Colocasia esculenta TaxID=4460 RepID=A0A843TV01_COLES|nr:hypothetical protein [Colocasia esculenta]
MKNGLDVMLNKLQTSEKEVVALKAEKQKIQNELKNTSFTSVRTKKNEKKSTITFVKSAMNKNPDISNGKLVKVLVQKQKEKKENATVKKIHLPSPSVQKAPRQVQNSHHAKSHQKDPNKCGSQNQLDQQAEDVDTRSGQVDTSPRFQKTQLPEKGGQVDTSSGQIDTSSGQVDTRPSFQQTSFAEMGEQVDTRSGQVDTLRLKICLHLQKLQAILSRGRTRESRGIPGEKVTVQGKGADPTEEAEEKKDFWHFRCHQSRASPIEENLHRIPSSLLN